MKVNLIKSTEVDKELFSQVVGLLEAIPGPILFKWDVQSVINFEVDELFIKNIPDRSYFEKIERLSPYKPAISKIHFPFDRETANWDVLFNKCSNYREKNGIANDEFVILLTDISNNKNWFASLDDKMPFNGFVHTADWAHYIDCSSAFPVAYEVVALILQKHMFQDEPIRSTVHENPIGCINDMCIQKRDIILKLRTADICRNCMERIKGKISMPVIHHALKLLESLRVKMLYAQNFRQDSPLSNLVIDSNRRIFLPGFGNIEIHLRPLEKALYILFLRHPEGIFLSSLSEHRQELFDIYSHISNISSLQDLHLRIHDLVNALSNSASEKISRIKRVFEEAIGEELAKHYYIRGNVGDAKKIALEAELINELAIR